MNAKSIKDKLKKLLQVKQPTDGNAIEQLKFAYTQQVCLKIKTLIEHNNKAHSLNTLKAYLAENGRLVRGSSLDYTAIPKSGVTELLVGVAVFVSKHLDSAAVTPIELLYPTISCISLLQTYPDLGAELASIEPTSEEREEFLRLNLQFEQCQHTETTQREAINKAIQHLIVTFSSFKTDEDKVVAGTHIRREGRLVPLQDPLAIICSHILSDDQKSLIPTQELISDKPRRVYDSTFTDLTDGELMRLRGHNNLARCYATTKRTHDLLVSDKSHLEGHLQTLIEKLKFNDAHGGIGTQERAGEGAYEALVDFKLYYDRLAPKLKSQLPDEVAREIEHLFHLTSFSRSISEQTCIGLRREALERVVKKHEATLVGIAVTKEIMTEQLAQLDKQLIQLCEARKMFVVRESYDGDKLPLKEDLLTLFDIQIDFNSFTNFRTFMQMADDDIRAFAADPHRSEALAGALKDHNQFLTFIRDLPNEKVALYLKVTEPFVSLYPDFRGNILAELIIRLHDEKIMICMDSAWGKSLIVTVRGLIALLARLSPNQQAIVWSCMVKRVPAIIQSAEDLKTVLGCLSEAQCALVCEAMKVQLPTIITSGVDFHGLMNALSEAKRASVYEAMQARLPAYIKSGSNFSCVMQFLSEAQRTSFFQAMQAQLPTIIKTNHDLGAVLLHLTKLQCATLCEAMKTQLPDIITSSNQLCDVLTHLSRDQRDTVYEAMQTQLPTLIRSANDFSFILKSLSTAQGDFVCEAMKTQLPDIITSYYEFTAVLNRISEVHGAIVCEAMKANLPTMITPALKFRYVLQNIFERQRPNVYETMKTQLPAIISSGREFHDILEFLSEAQRTNVYEAMQSQLPVIIKSDGNFSGVLAYLSEGQRINVYEAMKTHLPAIITSVSQLKSSLQYLSEEQCKAFCESMKTQLPAIIRSCSDFDKDMWYLSKPKRSSLYEVMKEQLPAMVRSSNDFRVVLGHLSLEQQAAFTASVFVLIGQKTFQEQTVFFGNVEPGAFLTHNNFINASKETCFLAGFKWRLARLREEEGRLTTQGALDAAKTTHDLHAKLDDALQQMNEGFSEKCVLIIKYFRSIFEQNRGYSPLFFSTGPGKLVDDMSNFVKTTPSR